MEKTIAYVVVAFLAGILAHAQLAQHSRQFYLNSDVFELTGAAKMIDNGNEVYVPVFRRK